MRYGAIKALGQLDGEHHRALIGQYVHDADDWTRSAAREAWAGRYLDERDARRARWAGEDYPTANVAPAELVSEEGCSPSEYKLNKVWGLPAAAEGEQEEERE